ncbi:uncharacterized protein LOC114360402 [Ostrinia furnacalis]|uniref:uncharacterized protein LOC114360402 n=1 Tax=Ostrinia furnacalis TaxID=93504 RepID=UPI00103C2CE3|nr:uncharacterized protein LOC114360402 [Ostrinia furnacalis]
MRLICFWCFLVAASVRAQDGYYAPQTFNQNNVDKGLFTPSRNDVSPQSTIAEPWRPKPVQENWNGKYQYLTKEQQAAIIHHKQALTSEGSFQFEYASDNGLAAGETIQPDGSRIGGYQYKDPSGQIVKLKYKAGKEGFQVDKGLFTPSRNDVSPQSTIAEPWRPKPVQENWNAPVEPWRPAFQLTKEQQAAIIHHKQALTSEGSFQFEYASDNGLAAGETIQPDGSRIGGYQYKDPSGQIVKLKYKAGKEGFQILEGSHIPKSPEPVPPLNQEAHHQQAYEQQRQAYELQQQYNQQRPEPNRWNNPQQYQEGPRPAPPSNQYYAPSWQRGNEDDGQYRENGVEDRGPHNFGEGYSFAFKG